MIMLASTQVNFIYDSYNNNLVFSIRTIPHLNRMNRLGNIITRVQDHGYNVLFSSSFCKDVMISS